MGKYSFDETNKEMKKKERTNSWKFLMTFTSACLMCAFSNRNRIGVVVWVGSTTRNMNFSLSICVFVCVSERESMNVSIFLLFILFTITIYLLSPAVFTHANGLYYYTIESHVQCTHNVHRTISHN